MTKEFNTANGHKFLNISWKLLLITFSISLVGVALLYSAANGKMEPWAIKQLYTILFTLPLIILLCLVDTYLIFKYAYVFYFICLFLLVLAEVLGHKAMGAQRWLKLGSLNIQPSEFVKLAIILSLARYFHTLHSNQVSNFKSLIIPIIIFLLPVILILKQPNLGTAAIIIMISAAIFFVSGVKIWKFALVIIAGLGILPVIWQFMHDYQKQRVLTFLDPERDPLGAGYNIIQSKIAIGSGGVLGKGFLQGSQNQLSFLPENQTDFIFTLLAEEFGLVGVAILLIMYFIVSLYCYYISFNCDSHFCRLASVGVATMLFIHVFINIGMISGMLPVVGTPLPFLSYGGSNLIASFLGIGIVLNSQSHKSLKLTKSL
ncbi:Rod shape-determining protein RodA [Candidatus Jidaibacter acanthamoeba]|uniref:Peptidoglycan glycosyltransferase MrdB n=1 Tax=Candidatus Jidaibacter acanthamoebae TaxID=86105 RepID=A0A0C1QY97_9RICK|nr:rod shape-determining protein RodA [Candidatus Jidaibacter acanthamoeba]KIE04980.1 Rod shape-determining protein RodA [Candidatus Jidaibacter acanthamoeba]